MHNRLPHPRSMSATQRREFRDSFAGSRYQGSEPQILSDETAIYATQEGLRFYLCVFIGQALRPARRVSGYYRSAEHRAAAIEQIKEGRAAYTAATLRRRQERSKLHTLKVGDVLYTSWGYDQTNVEFYEIINVRGHAVDLRELKQERTESSIGMQGECRARPGQYRGQLIRSKRPTGNNSIRIDSCSTATPWHGRPLSWSSYA